MGYINVANELLGTTAKNRPAGYPIILKVLMQINIENWEKLLILFQYIALAFLAIPIYKLYKYLHISTGVSIVFCVFILIAPGLVGTSALLLPELMLGFFITLAWFFTIQIISNKSRSPGKQLILATLSGFLSGFAVLQKPVWILGFIPLSLGVLFVFLLGRSYKGFYLGLTIALSHMLVHMAWQVPLIIKYDQYMLSNIGTVNLNLVSIRLSLTKHTEGTKLYSLIKQKGKLGEALHLKWKDDDKFSQFKKLAHSEPDTHFYKNAILKEPFKFLGAQIKRWPWFFMVRHGYYNKNSFPLMPKSVRYLYFGSYNWLFRPLMPILLLLSICYGLYRAELREITIISGLVLIYFSGMVTFLSYPVLLFTAFLPICIFWDKILIYKFRR
jgi:hypothetical protein